MNNIFAKKTEKNLSNIKNKIINKTNSAREKITKYITVLSGTSFKTIVKIKELAVGFRIEKLSKLSKKNIIALGSVTLAVVVICGAFALSGGNKAQEPDLPQLAKITDEPKEEISKPYFEINIDGLAVAALATKEEAEKVLEDVVAHYSTKDSEVISVEYKENVNIIEKEGVDPLLTQVEEAVTMIITGTKEPKVHTVESGDNLWDIAVKNGMTVDELIDSNPQADINHLKIGSTLNLYELKPYIHLSVTERLSTTEKIDYNIVYEETNTLYKGEIKVKTAGVYGKREVIKEIVKENGLVVATSEVSSSVVSQPSTQINLKGTKSLATLVGTGAFVSPMGHLEISSAYGSRGGGRHTGVDLRNPKGTPIYAVDDGVVTYSASGGSYGKMIKISHGNGIETWYAHCDTLLVSTGTVVKKGQQIATVGITGRATGYHLHLEVRKNGVPQNPMNYL